MRQVFSSRRLENVESLAQLMEEAGIETRIVNGRSYKGTHRHHFSYRDQARNQAPAPELWVVRTDQLPQAREILRDMGLLEATTRPGYAPLTFHSQVAANDGGRTPEQKAARLRMVLLILCVLAAGWMMLAR